jgi:hypothetical protein
MSRMENREVMGFFAINPKHHAAITSLVAPATTAHKLLDPFAGEGAFLEIAARAWNVTPYANELDGQQRTPSCHIPLNRPDVLHDALQRLLDANRRGWGAYFAVGLHRPGLARWRRGGVADVVALPALFVDLDGRHRLACAI